MGVISGKKPKLGTLDKSKMDWNSFVQEEGIKEELQTHNKGKDGQVSQDCSESFSSYDVTSVLSLLRVFNTIQSYVLCPTTCGGLSEPL